MNRNQNFVIWPAYISIMISMFRFYFLLLLFLFFESANAQSNCILLESVSSGSRGVESHLKRTYSANGQLLEEWQLNSAGSEGSYTTKKVFDYNAKGYLFKISEYQNDVFRSTKVRTYDNFGKLISESESFTPDGLNLLNKLLSSETGTEKLFYDDNNILSGKEITLKNSEGKTTKYELRNAQGKINHSEEHIYDDFSNEVYLKRNDVVGGMIEETFSDFSEDGKIEKDSTFLNNKLIAKTNYSYADGYLVKKVRYGRNNKLEYEIEYQNDSEGNVLEERFVYHGDLLSLVQYNYDRFGNLILEKRFNDKNELLRTKTWDYSCPN